MNPLGFCLTGGEVSGRPHFGTLLYLGPDITLDAAVADKGFGVKANRYAARCRDIGSAIPDHTTTKDKPTFFPKLLSCGSARIEETMDKIKQFKRVPQRCGKTDENYSSVVAPALSFILVKSVTRPRAAAVLTESETMRRGDFVIPLSRPSLEEMSDDQVLLAGFAATGGALRRGGAFLP